MPAFGPGRVSFEHIRAFLSPYNATTFEYVPNDVAKRQPRPPHDIVLRAFSFYQRGFGEYNCAVNNCEDFVLQCVYAMPPLLSDQTKVRITMSIQHNGCDFYPLACIMTNSIHVYRSARTKVLFGPFAGRDMQKLLPRVRSAVSFLPARSCSKRQKQRTSRRRSAHLCRHAWCHEWISYQRPSDMRSILKCGLDSEASQQA